MPSSTPKITTLAMPRLGKSERPRIAFYGQMASGKSWCADYLVSSTKYQKFSFASKLKTLAYNIFGIVSKDGGNRQFLQEFGDFLRKWDGNIFIKHAILSIKDFESRNDFVGIVMDDLRYVNEATVLKKNDFILVKVEADESIRMGRIKSLYPNFDWNTMGHKSEKDCDNITPDYVVKSNNPADTAMALEELMDNVSKNRFSR